MGSLGLGGDDIVGIFIASWLPEDAILGTDEAGRCGMGATGWGTGVPAAPGRETGATGRDKTGWTGWTWCTMGGGPLVFTDGGWPLGLGFLCRNEQKGFRHPLGWDS